MRVRVRVRMRVRMRVRERACECVRALVHVFERVHERVHEHVLERTHACVRVLCFSDCFAANAGLLKHSTWTVVTSSAAFSVRSFLGLVTVESGLLVFGGYAGSGAFFNDLWLSKDAGLTWREIAATGTGPGTRSAGRLVPLRSGDSCLQIAGWQRGYLQGGASGAVLYHSDAWVVPEI